MPSLPASDYWLRRQRALLEQMERDEARLNARLAEVYETEAARLERDIAAKVFCLVKKYWYFGIALLLQTIRHQ